MYITLRDLSMGKYTVVHSIVSFQFFKQRRKHSHPVFIVLYCIILPLSIIFINQFNLCVRTDHPLSEDIGTLCAGLAATADVRDERGALIEVSDQSSLESLLDRYEAALLLADGDEALDDDVDVIAHA